MSYAVISVGGKQYRVSEGQRLLVDRIHLDDGGTFSPGVLLVGGEGETQIAPTGVTVTARVIDHQRGPKIRIGKYKKRTGYKRHTGFRSALTQIEIESIAAAAPKRSRAKKEQDAPVAEAAVAIAEAPVEMVAVIEAVAVVAETPADVEEKPKKTRARKPKVEADRAPAIVETGTGEADA
jgi:large subunit ribosomal protein L21